MMVVTIISKRITAEKQQKVFKMTVLEFFALDVIVKT